MKNKLIILLFTIFIGFTQTKAQSFGVPDTLAYLQTLVVNKAFFIGKPFSVLRDSLKIQIKHFSPFPGIHYDNTRETSTSFSFYFPNSSADYYLTYPRLRISWYPNLNFDQSALYFNQFNGGWVPTVINYYAAAIIHDIGILE